MRIAIGSVLKGFNLKNMLKEYLEEKKNIKIIDMGAISTDKFIKYHLVASKVAEAVQRGDVDGGILICGTGMGMAIAANKYRGIHAACCESIYSARMSRAVNDSNILTLGEDIVGPGLACRMVDIWLETRFKDAPGEDWLKTYWKEAVDVIGKSGLEA